MKYYGGEFLEIRHQEFDKIIIHEGDSFKEVFAYKGKVAVYIRYFGYADIDTIIESLAQKLSTAKE